MTKEWPRNEMLRILVAIQNIKKGESLYQNVMKIQDKFPQYSYEVIKQKINRVMTRQENRGDKNGERSNCNCNGV